MKHGSDPGLIQLKEVDGIFNTLESTEKDLRILFMNIYPHIPLQALESLIASYSPPTSQMLYSNKADRPKELHEINPAHDIQFLLPGDSINFTTSKDFPEQFEFELFCVRSGKIQSKLANNQRALRELLCFTKLRLKDDRHSKQIAVVYPKNPKLNSFDHFSVEFEKNTSPVAICLRTKASLDSNLTYNRSLLFFFCSDIHQVDLSYCKQFRNAISPRYYPYPPNHIKSKDTIGHTMEKDQKLITHEQIRMKTGSSNSANQINSTENSSSSSFNNSKNAQLMQTYIEKPASLVLSQLPDSHACKFW